MVVGAVDDLLEATAVDVLEDAHTSVDSFVYVRGGLRRHVTAPGLPKPGDGLSLEWKNGRGYGKKWFNLAILTDPDDPHNSGCTAHP